MPLMQLDALCVSKCKKLKYLTNGKQL